MIFNKLKFKKLEYRIQNLIKPDDFVNDGNGLYRVNIDFIEWLEQFIENQFPERKTELCFVGVFGPRKSIKKYPGRKIFFTGENVEPPIIHKNISESLNSTHGWFDRVQYNYSDYRHNEVDLAIGFAGREQEFSNYLRFPLWILYQFPPKVDYEEIKEIVSTINAAKSCASRGGGGCMHK